MALRCPIWLLGALRELKYRYRSVGIFGVFFSFLHTFCPVRLPCFSFYFVQACDVVSVKLCNPECSRSMCPILVRSSFPRSLFFTLQTQRGGSWNSERGFFGRDDGLHYKETRSSTALRRWVSGFRRVCAWFLTCSLSCKIMFFFSSSTAFFLCDCHCLSRNLNHAAFSSLITLTLSLVHFLGLASGARPQQPRRQRAQSESAPVGARSPPLGGGGVLAPGEPPPADGPVAAAVRSKLAHHEPGFVGSGRVARCFCG